MGNKNSGRLSKYNKEIQKIADDYVNSFENNSNDIPFVEELALKLGVNEDTVVEWSKINPVFSATYLKLKVLNKIGLKRGAINGTFKENMSKFLLNVDHGLIEVNKQIQDSNVKFDLDNLPDDNQLKKVLGKNVTQKS